MKIAHIAKSKTMNFNVWMPIIITILEQFDVKVTPELAVSIMALGNIVLRFITHNQQAGKPVPHEK